VWSGDSSPFCRWRGRLLSIKRKRPEPPIPGKHAARSLRKRSAKVHSGSRLQIPAASHASAIETACSLEVAQARAGCSGAKLGFRQIAPAPAEIRRKIAQITPPAKIGAELAQVREAAASSPEMLEGRPSSKTRRTQTSDKMVWFPAPLRREQQRALTLPVPLDRFVRPRNDLSTRAEISPTDPIPSVAI